MAANAPTCAHHCAMQVVYKIVSLDGADWRGWSIRATDGWVARYFVCFSRRCRIIHLVNRWRLGKIAAQSENSRALWRKPMVGPGRRWELRP